MRFADLIVCDDIRREQGNKFSLMGVVGASMILPAGAWRNPAQSPVLRLAFFQRFWLDEHDVAPNRFSIRLTLQGRNIGEIADGMQIANRREPVTLGITVPGLALPEPGELQLSVTLLSGETVLVEHVPPPILLVEFEPPPITAG